MYSKNNWQLLIVDDEEDLCRQVKEFLEGEKILPSGDSMQVETLTNFDMALQNIEKHKYDLIILDVRLGAHDIKSPGLEEAGVKILDAIKARCFLPVVFYTGLPHLVRHLENPVIRIVEKSEGFDNLMRAVMEIFTTNLPAVNRALVRHIERVQSRYMWEFVVNNWNKFGDTQDRTSLAYLLARRLAMSLSTTGIQQMAQELGVLSPLDISGKKVHPMQYYIMPPVENTPQAGDLYKGNIEDSTGYWILITPSCDIFQNKADMLLFIKGIPLKEHQIFLKWLKGLPDPSNTIISRFFSLLEDRGPERYFFLPGVFDLPDLVVDFQYLNAIKRDRLESLKRLASLDVPFASKLISRFGRYYIRQGAPDLMTEVIIERLKNGLAAIAQVAAAEDK